MNPLLLMALIFGGSWGVGEIFSRTTGEKAEEKARKKYGEKLERAQRIGQATLAKQQEMGEFIEGQAEKWRPDVLASMLNLDFGDPFYTGRNVQPATPAPVPTELDRDEEGLLPMAGLDEDYGSLEALETVAPLLLSGMGSEDEIQELMSAMKLERKMGDRYDTQQIVKNPFVSLHRSGDYVDGQI